MWVLGVESISYASRKLHMFGLYHTLFYELSHANNAFLVIIQKKNMIFNGYLAPRLYLA